MKEYARPSRHWSSRKWKFLAVSISVAITWILWVELRGFPKRGSLYVDIPVSKIVLDGRDATVVTNKPIVIGSPGSITESDFLEIRRKLRRHVYKGRFLHTIEILSTNCVTAWNTNKWYSVQLDREENSWQAHGIQQAIVD